MCVIAFAEEKRPTPEMVTKMYNRNSDGAGIAWREPAEDGNGMEVVWRKGLDLKTIQELVATAPLPFVAHFRISSCEKPPRKSLTHPFPTEPDAPVWLSGRTKGYVLFHNGHYGDWKKDLKDTLKSFGAKLPDGKFNDTRAMAVMCAYYGRGYMDLIEAKGIAFGPDDEELFWGSGWDKVEGVWCSNSGFTSQWVDPNDPTGANSVGRGVSRSFTMCHANHCIEDKNLDDLGYCPKHTRHINKREKDEDDDTTPQVQIIRSGNVAETKPNMTPLPNDEPRGARSDDPFAHLLRVEELHKAGKVGKRQVKRARKAYEKSQLQAVKAAAKQRQGLMEQAPPIVMRNVH